MPRGGVGWGWGTVLSTHPYPVTRRHLCAFSSDTVLEGAVVVEGRQLHHIRAFTNSKMSRSLLTNIVNLLFILLGKNNFLLIIWLEVT